MVLLEALQPFGVMSAAIRIHEDEENKAPQGRNKTNGGNGGNQRRAVLGEIRGFNQNYGQTLQKEQVSFLLLLSPNSHDSSGSGKPCFNCIVHICTGRFFFVKYQAEFLFFLCGEFSKFAMIWCRIHILNQLWSAPIRFMTLPKAIFNDFVTDYKFFT